MGLGIVFSGQGNQYPEMYAKVGAALNPADIKTIADALKINVLPKIDLTPEQLFSNHYAQPLIASHGFLVWNTLKKDLPEPVAFAGYSLGEVTALACACDFSLEELLAVTQTRAQLMSAPIGTTSGLLAVSGVEATTLNNICQTHHCALAIINAPRSLIIGGSIADLTQCQIAFQQLPGQIHLQWLKVEVAAHTSLLAKASADFANYLTQFNNKNLNTRIISSINTHVQYQTAEAFTALAGQIHQTVNFAGVIKVLSELGADVILEIGPGKSLSKIIQQQGLPLTVKSIDDFKTPAEVAHWIKSKCRVD